MPSCVYQAISKHLQRRIGEPTKIVQRAEHQIEPFHPLDIILAFFNVSVPRPDRHPLGIHVSLPLRARSRVKMPRKRRRHESLALLDISLSEKELSIQIRQVNRVEVDDLNVAETNEDEVLEQFAPDAAGADDEKFGGADAGIRFGAEEGACVGISVAGHYGAGAGSSDVQAKEGIQEDIDRR